MRGRRPPGPDRRSQQWDKRASNQEPLRDSEPGRYDGRRTPGHPHLHGILSGRQKISLPWSLGPTRLERALGRDFHLCMKFSTERGVATIRGNQHEARKCYRNALRKAEKKEVNMTIRVIEMKESSEETPEDVEMEEASSLKDIDPRIMETNSQTSSVEELENFPADPDDPTRKL
ncbi:Uncharacterized protein Adt_47015 [Abeliophyllum distichum]|uniref:Uncharacterized protein n=1 Tax=Abeliophyllum distichum TaxID=126358 RepID=A0ABD1NX29_9LAMI